MVKKTFNVNMLVEICYDKNERDSCYMVFLNKKNEIEYSIDFYYIIILTWSDYCQQLVDF